MVVYIKQDYLYARHLHSIFHEFSTTVYTVISVCPLEGIDRGVYTGIKHLFGQRSQSSS